MKKNERLLFLGRWTSHIGNIIFDYANSVNIVKNNMSSALILAIYQSSETLVSIILNLVGGVVADKSNKRKKILICTDLLSALVCFILSFVAGGKYLGLILIIANIALALINAFNSPTYKSIIKDTIHKDRILFFNSISNGGNELIKIVGPMIAMLLVNSVGVGGALQIDALTFLISAIAEMRLVTMNQDNLVKKKNNIFADMKEGFVYLTKEKMILCLVTLSAVVNFFLAGYNLFLPYTDVMYNRPNCNFYSKIMIVEAVGGIVASFVVSRIKKNTDKLSTLFLLLGITGGSLIFVPIMSCFDYWMICLIPYLLFGAFLTMFNIRFISYVQMKVNNDYLGRVFSIIFTVAVLFMPIGSFTFSFLFHTTEIRNFYFVGGGIIICSLIFRYISFRKHW